MKLEFTPGMSLMDMGLAMQAASIGKKPSDYTLRKVPCPGCKGTLTNEQERRCLRCDNGFIEVKCTQGEQP